MELLSPDFYKSDITTFRRGITTERTWFLKVYKKEGRGKLYAIDYVYVSDILFI